MSITIDLQVICEGYDRKTCWVHARAGLVHRADAPPIAVVTMHELRITGDDVFYPIHSMRSDDGGVTWTKPVDHGDAFARRQRDDGIEEGICDFTPAWHESSGCLLGIGATIPYFGDNVPPQQMVRATAYSVYEPDAHTWRPWRTLADSPFPQQEEGAGSVQRIDLPNGDILLPTCYSSPQTSDGPVENRYETLYNTAVLRCGFDGQTLRYIEQGNEMTRDSGRGYCESSLTHFKGRYFLTLRNNDAAYVAVGNDGQHFDPPRAWTFDDGSDLGSYNTQAHWVTMPDALYLVYTRRAQDNDNVLRHRAPLWIAQVDPDKLCVIRETEKVLVPNRGAGLGNFGVTRVSDTESWVVVAEWMQTHGPDYWDCKFCEKFGSNNAVFLARICSTLDLR